MNQAGKRRKFAKLGPEEERDYAVLMRFRAEFYRGMIQDASNRSAIVIADSAQAKLDYRKKGQRDYLLALMAKKMKAVAALSPTTIAANFAKRRAAFLIRKLLKQGAA